MAVNDPPEIWNEQITSLRACQGSAAPDASACSFTTRSSAGSLLSGRTGHRGRTVSSTRPQASRHAGVLSPVLTDSRPGRMSRGSKIR
jgi:hypothetical protein